jgi:hypothetical protein
MSKIYEVLLWTDPVTHQRDIRCRSDIDNQQGFTRLSDNRIRHIDYLKSGRERTFTLVFTGNERTAKRIAEGLKLVFDATGIERSILVQS